MKIVCSHCRKVLREQEPGDAGLSHGMCVDCSDHFGRLWRGMSISEYLDEIPVPILVVDGTRVRVAGANRTVAAALGVSREQLVGLRGGEAMACKHSRLPEGCGETVHCRECTLRRSVLEVARTGQTLSRVEAFLDTSAGRVPLTMTVQPLEGGFVQVTLLDLRPPVPIPEGCDEREEPRA